jgi:acyl-CoA synthetase (AMP-forming)/AMP-acid ligase II
VNVAQHVERAAAWFPDHPAILFDGRALSYRELDARAGRLANDLMAHGVARGDRIALSLPNIPDFAVCYLAALKAGAVAVSINAIFKSAEVAHVVNDSGARALHRRRPGGSIARCSRVTVSPSTRRSPATTTPSVTSSGVWAPPSRTWSSRSSTRTGMSCRGRVGEICIQSPGVMKGYWGRPDDTAAAIRQGWLRSGDIGTMDDEVGELPKSATGKILKRVLRTR